MSDPRVQKLAQVMVHDSLGIKRDQKVYMQTTPVAHEFNLAFYEEAIKAGAHVTIFIDGNYYPGAQEIFLKHASKNNWSSFPLFANY
jgi:aminopeptidase